MNAPNPAWSIQCENGLYIIWFILNTKKSPVKIFSAPKRRKCYFSVFLALILMFLKSWYKCIYQVWSKNSFGKCVFWVKVHRDPPWPPRSAQYLDHLSVKGVLHLLLKISMFCALSENYQHLLEKKYMHLTVNCLRNSKMALEFSRPSDFLSCRSKYSKCCLDLYLKNRSTYYNFDAIFEFLGQFTIRGIHLFSKRCW